MIKCIILDLDGTLINTSALEGLREQGRWREIESSLHLCSPYSQVIDVLNTARSAGLKVCIVTNSPSNYAQRLLNYFNLSIDYLVTYNDVRNHKPDSEGVEKVLSHFQVCAEEAVYLGDSRDDFLASRTANVEYFSVEWSDPTVVPECNFGISKLLEFIGSNTSDAHSKTKRSEIIQSANHFYLGYYLDGIKQEIWAFKDGHKSAINRWLNKTQELATSLPNVDYVVRALGHSEIQLGGSDPQRPLDQLSERLAESLNATYCPICIQKNRVLVKSTQCSAKERELQVHGAYSVNLDAIRTSKNNLTFLVVDDVFTSGATTRDITRALCDAYPKARIYIFTLVKTLYRSQAGGTTVEAQHNSQLFSDLYTLGIESQIPLDESTEQLFTQSLRSNLVTKRFSANYTKTNHNFVFHNLKSFSIASEPESRSILNAIYILKNMLQRGKPTIASRKLRHAFGCEEYFSGNDNLQALISQKPITWQRLIRRFSS